jgi:hypothetical protein
VSVTGRTATGFVQPLRVVFNALFDGDSKHESTQKVGVFGLTTVKQAGGQSFTFEQQGSSFLRFGLDSARGSLSIIWESAKSEPSKILYTKRLHLLFAVMVTPKFS